MYFDIVLYLHTVCPLQNIRRGLQFHTGETERNTIQYMYNILTPPFLTGPHATHTPTYGQRNYGEKITST